MLDMQTIGAAVVIILLIALVLGAGFLKRRPRQLDTTYFQAKWKEAQDFCVEQSTWPLAVINADKLLDEALKRRKYKGKTMGERMVAAQRDMSDNDGVWFAHKLRNRLVHETEIKLTKSDVKKALFGIRQALKDLGANVK
jgi:hypothetical protein